MRARCSRRFAVNLLCIGLTHQQVYSRRPQRTSSYITLLGKQKHDCEELQYHDKLID